MSTEAEWRAAYDLKVAELARETGRASRLIAAIEGQGHTGRIPTRQFADCPLCIVLREVTQPAAEHQARLAAENPYEGPKGEHSDCTWGEMCKVFPDLRHEFAAEPKEPS